MEKYKIIWEESAKRDFAFWLRVDKLIVKRIELLISAIEEDPEFGIGKPEKLKHKFLGYFSRRITLEHRIIYKILQKSKEVIILTCKGHYE
ncbi:MAG: Txe/YoeB family addiction module toxin [Alphaproteobacteria bacterium]|nr:Txe/YoeB family addiction module toxin [Alphaproteobacteria bacterium]